MKIAQNTIPILETLESKSEAENFGLVTDLGDYVSKFASTILIVAGIATFIYIIIGGIRWMLAGTDKTKVQDAQARLTNGMIGLGVVAGAWAVFLLVDYFFGLGLTEATQ
ncbi:hypothetical protein ACFL1M_02565 [Patescibacteria group bacterium]